MSSIRIEVGDRVRSVESQAPVLHEGVVQSIALGVTETGYAPVLRVMVDLIDGKPVKPHLHESHPILWNKVLPDDSIQESPAICDFCGEVHETGVFTPEMISMYQDLAQLDPKDSELEEKKSYILSNLGQRFADKIDPFDANIPEWAHALAEEIGEAQEEYDLAFGKLDTALLKAGRFVARSLSEISRATAMHTHQESEVKVPFPKFKKNPNGSLN